MKNRVRMPTCKKWGGSDRSTNLKTKWTDIFPRVKGECPSFFPKFLFAKEYYSYMTSLVDDPLAPESHWLRNIKNLSL